MSYELMFSFGVKAASLRVMAFQQSAGLSGPLVKTGAIPTSRGSCAF